MIFPAGGFGSSLGGWPNLDGWEPVGPKNLKLWFG